MIYNKYEIQISSGSWECVLCFTQSYLFFKQICPNKGLCLPTRVSHVQECSMLLMFCFRYSLVYFCVIFSWLFDFTSSHLLWQASSLDHSLIKNRVSQFWQLKNLVNICPSRAPSLWLFCQSSSGWPSLAALDVALLLFPSRDTHSSPHPEFGVLMTLCPKAGRTGDSV